MLGSFLSSLFLVREAAAQFRPIPVINIKHWKWIVSVPQLVNLSQKIYPILSKNIQEKHGKDIDEMKFPHFMKSSLLVLTMSASVHGFAKMNPNLTQEQSTREDISVAVNTAQKWNKEYSNFHHTFLGYKPPEAYNYFGIQQDLLALEKDGLSQILARCISDQTPVINQELNVKVTQAHPVSISIVNKNPGQTSNLIGGKYFEAFTQQEIFGVNSTQITLECNPDKAGKCGWQESESKDSWPTISWINTQQNFNPDVELMSFNTIALLSKLAGQKQQSNLGIVFGRIPSDWDIESTAGESTPIILDQSYNIAHKNNDQERFFVFLNVFADEMKVFYLVDVHKNSRQVAVVCPVLQGKATYLDLTSIYEKTFSVGIIKNSQQISTDDISIHVVGQEPFEQIISAKQISNFQLNNVLVVGPYPIFLETAKKDEYIHRHVTNPENSRLSLQEISARTIDNLSNELEGGIPEGVGIIFGEVPKLFFQKTREISVKISEYNKRQEGSEIYLIERGSLKVGQPLTRGNRHFFGIESKFGGIKIVTAYNTLGELIGSKFFSASPNVVSVVNF